MTSPLRVELASRGYEPSTAAVVRSGLSGRTVWALLVGVLLAALVSCSSPRSSDGSEPKRDRYRADDRAPDGSEDAASRAELVEAPETLEARTTPPGIQDGMISVAEQSFTLPSGSTYRLSAFALDRTEVLHREFADFVSTTGYVTEAEEWGWALVFEPRSRADPEAEMRVPATPWWLKVDGASWRDPRGDGTEPKPDHPVVQVSWNDARAYCNWREARLPTEAEWRLAAAAGDPEALYAWPERASHHQGSAANIWHGDFPAHDQALDGFSGLAPVASFPSNRWGFYDLGGNVWEWVEDWYGPREPAGIDPRGPATGSQRVMLGGSWLCSEDFCRGYRLDQRNQSPPDSALDHVGFRCAKSLEGLP